MSLSRAVAGPMAALPAFEAGAASCATSAPCTSLTGRRSPPFGPHPSAIRDAPKVAMQPPAPLGGALTTATSAAA